MIRERFLVVDPRHPASAAQIHRVFQASYRVEAGLLEIADFPPLRRTVEEIEVSSNRFFGVVHDPEGRQDYELERREGALGHGELVAVTEVRTVVTDKSLFIDSFTVHPSRFRQGVGSRLLDHVLGVFAGRTLRVSTAAANEPAIRLYEKKGFQMEESRRRKGGLLMVTLLRVAAPRE